MELEKKSYEELIDDECAEVIRRTPNIDWMILRDLSKYWMEKYNITFEHPLIQRVYVRDLDDEVKFLNVLRKKVPSKFI